MNDMTPLGTFVELHVPDFFPIRKFYTDIGFEILWEREPEAKKGYLVTRFQNNVLCFWCGNDSVYKQSYFKDFPSTTPRGYGVEIVIMVDDIEIVFDRLKDHDHLVSPLKLRAWGIRDFRILDPFGFYLRFTEPLDIRDPRYAVE